MRRIVLLVLLLGFVFSPEILYAKNSTSAGSMEDKQQNLRERKENLQENRKEKRLEFQQKREETLATISARIEAKKQQKIENIQVKLNTINERRINHFLKILERLQDILNRIESREIKADEAGKDVSTVETAIRNAQTLIDQAIKNVNTQKAKEYQIVVDEETTARNDVGATAKQLQEDLRLVRESVKAARDAVFSAHRVLRVIRGIDDVGSTETPSAIPT